MGVPRSWTPLMPSEFIGGEKHALAEALEKAGLAKQSLWES